jgi:ferric enterobactin receptor
MKPFSILFSFYSCEKTTAVTVLFLLFTLFAKAQHPENTATGVITGRVIDSVSKQPVEYASISLLTQENDKVVNGTTTDDKGNFKLINVADGNYKMLIYFIGYRTGVQNTIVVNKTNPTVVLGDVRLSNKQSTLKEVAVTAEKSIIENKIDKLVYNADQDVTSQSGVAADVLKKVPEVSIDVNGNVELQGNSSIRFLINGKPSVIFGNNIVDVLQSIPASQIKSIEVITSPGAKYDAEGIGGIINIILKKSTTEGINGNVSLSAGSRLENGAINVNAHHDHFSANAFANGNAQLSSTTVNNMDRFSNDVSSLQTTHLTQNGTSDFSRKGFESGAGFDWEISPKNDLSGSLGFNYFGNNNSGTSNRNTTLKDDFGNILNTVNDKIITGSDAHQQSIDWGLNYKRTFKNEDQKLELSYLSSSGNNYAHYNQSQHYLLPDSVYSGSYGNNPGTSKETTIALDYSQPIGENITLETGAKAILSEINSMSDVYLLNTSPDDYRYNTTQSYTLNYKSNVYAGYVSGAFKLFNWLDVKTGLRYEYTEPHAFFFQLR